MVGIRMEKCCCGLVKVETASRIFAVISLVFSFLLIGFAFFHKHLYRWEPYIFGTAGIFGVIAAILVLVACAKKRDDFMVLQMIVGALVIFVLAVLTIYVVYAQFASDSKLQLSARKTVTNMGIGQDAEEMHRDKDDSREEEATTRSGEAKERARINKWTRIVSALVLIVTLLLLAYNIWAFVTYFCTYVVFQDFQETTRMEEVKCKTIIPERISNRFFPEI